LKIEINNFPSSESKRVAQLLHIDNIENICGVVANINMLINHVFYTLLT